MSYFTERWRFSGMDEPPLQCNGCGLWDCNCGVHWLAAKMAEPTDKTVVDYEVEAREILRNHKGIIESLGGFPDLPDNCTDGRMVGRWPDDEIAHLPTDFWRKAFQSQPVQDGGTMPNPYGSIDPNPPRQWTDSEKRAGAAIARAVGR